MLKIRDKYSFDFPDIKTESEWDDFQNQTWRDAKVLINHWADFPEHRGNDYFTDKKYGTYFTNMMGLIEHTHYHLGQIAVIKKIIEARTAI